MSEELKESSFATAATGIAIVIATLVGIALTLEVGTSLLSARSSTEAATGFALIVLVTPAILFVGIWLFKMRGRVW